MTTLDEVLSWGSDKAYPYMGYYPARINWLVECVKTLRVLVKQAEGDGCICWTGKPCVFCRELHRAKEAGHL